MVQYCTPPQKDQLARPRRQMVRLALLETQTRQTGSFCADNLLLVDIVGQFIIETNDGAAHKGDEARPARSLESAMSTRTKGRKPLHSKRYVRFTAKNTKLFILWFARLHTAP